MTKGPQNPKAQDSPPQGITPPLPQGCRLLGRDERLLLSVLDVGRHVVVGFGWRGGWHRVKGRDGLVPSGVVGVVQCTLVHGDCSFGSERLHSSGPCGLDSPTNARVLRLVIARAFSCSMKTQKGLFDVGGQGCIGRAPPPPLPLFEAKFSSAPLVQEDLCLKSFSGAFGAGVGGTIGGGGIRPTAFPPPPLGKGV